MKRTRKFYLGIAAIALFGIGTILATTLIYSARQLHELQYQTVYVTPEEGAQELIAHYYPGVNKVEIVHADREIFDDLWFVEAHIWVYSRSDGKGFSGRNYDNPGWFFLHTQNGWAFIPESKFPEIIAFGKWLYDFSG
jgi:hypothetical protein